MMPPDEDMVVVDRVCQEIVRYLGCCFDPHLRAAEILLVLATLQSHIDRQHPFQVSG